MSYESILVDAGVFVGILVGLSQLRLNLQQSAKLKRERELEEAKKNNKKQPSKPRKQKGCK